MFFVFTPFYTLGCFQLHFLFRSGNYMITTNTTKAVTARGTARVSLVPQVLNLLHISLHTQHANTSLSDARNEGEDEEEANCGLCRLLHAAAHAVGSGG